MGVNCVSYTVLADMFHSPLLQAVGTADTTQLSPAVAKGGHRAGGGAEGGGAEGGGAEGDGELLPAVQWESIVLTTLTNPISPTQLVPSFIALIGLLNQLFHHKHDGNHIKHMGGEPCHNLQSNHLFNL